MSFGAGSVDMWLLRIDEYGNHMWNKTYGRSGSENCRALIECGVGGFLMSGASYNHGDPNGGFWVIKVDDLGIEDWNQTYPGAGTDYPTDLVEAANGGFGCLYDHLCTFETVPFLQ